MLKTIHSKEYKQVVERLKKSRINSGLTQSEVAQKLGKSQSYISKVEVGEQRLDVIELKKLARIYKKNINVFI